MYNHTCLWCKCAWMACIKLLDNDVPHCKNALCNSPKALKCKLGTSIITCHSPCRPTFHKHLKPPPHAKMPCKL